MSDENTISLDSDQEDTISKTQRKKDMLALQNLGEKLTVAPRTLLEKCRLPEELLHAINEYKRIPKRRGARKRQLQFIGKVMREVDVQQIRSILDEDGQQSEKEKSRFQRLEKIRERLVSGDIDMLNKLISQNSGLDIQYIRQLIRQATKETQEGKPTVASRKLFSYLKELPDL